MAAAGGVCRVPQAKAKRQRGRRAGLEIEYEEERDVGRVLH
jgi:hypothetical protein